MASETEDWLRDALESYRAGRIELEKWRSIQLLDVELDFFVEELKDELLELKQATINRDVVTVEQCNTNIGLLIFEIRIRSEGHE